MSSCREVVLAGVMGGMGASRAWTGGCEGEFLAVSWPIDSVL